MGHIKWGHKQLGICAVLLTTTSCVDDTNRTLIEPTRVEWSTIRGNVSVTPPSATVAVGGQFQFAAVKDSAGQAVPISANWLVKDGAIASVDAAGVVTGLSVGTTLIGAETVEGFGTASLTVTATTPVSGTTASSLQPKLASYLGGSGPDMVRDVAADAQGNFYVAGSTASRNFPVTGASFDRSFNTGTKSSYHDAFLAKVSPSGQLLWSTYLGGTGFDRIYALELDPQGFVYVAGRAGPGFPVTAGAFQTRFAGGNAGGTYGTQDGFICKFGSSGARVWCSYFGDSDVLAIRDLAVDGQGNVYVGAATATGTFPAGWFVNAFQKTRRGGYDLVIAKILSNGSRVVWATYLGGSLDEVTTPTIRVDAAQNVLVFTGTASADLPTPNGFDHALNGPSDGYVAKIAADGTRLLWATYLGGSGRELNETHSMAVDPRTGEVIVAAGTTSTDFPVTGGAFQSRFGGMGATGSGLGTNYPGDAFVTRIAANGTRIIASTYFGGSDGDGAEGVWIDTFGSVYVSGTTFSSDFPVSSAPTGSLGKGDIFIAKLESGLTRRIYASGFGGTSFDVGRACFVDDSGNAYLVGESGSQNLTTFNAFQPRIGGGLDGVVFTFVPK